MVKPTEHTLIADHVVLRLSELSDGSLVGTLENNIIGSHMTYDLYYSDLEEAKQFLRELTYNEPVTPEELLQIWQKLFPDDLNVVEVHTISLAARCALWGIKPDGYDVVQIRASSLGGARVLLIHIPTSGLVRCPSKYMGRVIGRKGIKIKELERKHQIKHIQLVEAPLPTLASLLDLPPTNE